MRYSASQVLAVSWPYSTDGLDVLAFIGWQHEHEHRQLIAIQRLLNTPGVLSNERSVGTLSRQLLALRGGILPQRQERVAAAAPGGVIWAVGALQPESDGPLLYVLNKVVSGTAADARGTQRHGRSAVHHTRGSDASPEHPLCSHRL